MSSPFPGTAVTALTRFGLGARPGEAAEIAADPIGYLRAQIAAPKSARIAAKLPSAREALVRYAAFQAERREPDAPDDLANPSGAILRSEALARARHAAATDAPFVERLVMFWSNLFAVSVDKGPVVRATSGAFEREAIRPHVLGRFADMLAAATRHPAMLAYLDNARSTGPRSPLGRQSRVGLNENLARETLELHSLGADGGYDQADVTALAKIITGWRTATERRGGKVGTFYFDAAAHEPGDFTVLGKRYPGRGVKQGEAVLADLARHPATARNLALRMARHFVGDNAPTDLVASLETTFRKTDGDLRALAATLVGHTSAWEAPPRKFLPPYDFILACHRLTGLLPTAETFLSAASALGQPLWRPPSPEGYPDGDADWIASDALVERFDCATRIAEASAGATDVVALAHSVLGPRLDPETRIRIARAPTRSEALALLMASAEFQTR